MIDAILYPSDFFNCKCVDQQYKDEMDSCKKHGISCLIFNQDAWFSDYKIVLNTSIDKPIKALYRGFMMNPEEYRTFYKKLKEQNIQLIITSSMYELFHCFPNAYPLLKDDTPRIMTFSKGERIDLRKVNESFSRFMVKDYVKSVKGSIFPTFFTNDISQCEFDEYMKIFYQYRGNQFTGGICVKEYVDLKYYGNHTNEFRVFYMNQRIGYVCANSNQANMTIPVPTSLIEKYSMLTSPFYTIDFAEKKDGHWIVIECGDGQVSGLPLTADIDTFYRQLMKYMK